MRHLHVSSDITIIGGGLAGVCAAIAAARAGAKVALVQNRPMLGGNSSSEVRVWVVGATAHGVQNYARETGIMGELALENQYSNPDGNPYYWDLVILEAVRAEPNISLYLNTDVRHVQAAGPDDQRTILGVTGWQMTTETQIAFSSPTFIDCSGDGLVGYLAGARFRLGREARSEFEESWAPELPDKNLLGSTILFYTKDVGHSVRFIPPKFAVDISKSPIPTMRSIRTKDQGCAYWWIEFGGELDIVQDGERIRDELQGLVYGIWNYIKNSGNFDADTLTLEWVGSLPGKREYRRFIGDYTLTQNDIVGQEEFDDRVAFGGWSIDLHPVEGVHSSEKSAYHWHPDGNYHLPLRCLYSQNVTNMWMAGRNISATHVAFGGTRVMATCAVLGEAAGAAAAVALRHRVTPRQLATERFDLVRYALIRSDASMLGVENNDPCDLSHHATAKASSTLDRLAVTKAAQLLHLKTDVGLLLPLDPAIRSGELLVDCAVGTELVVDLYNVAKPQNYLPYQLCDQARVSLTKGEGQWAAFKFDGPQESGAQNVFVIIRANEHVRLHVSDTAMPGTLCFEHRSTDPADPNGLYFRDWKRFLERKSICFRIAEPTKAYAPDRVIGGYARPYGGPQMWISGDVAADPEPWIQLTWPEGADLSEVVVLFDDEVEEDLINLHHHHTPYEVMPGLVRDYEIEVHDGHGWSTVASVQGNRHRRRMHRLPRTTNVRDLRLTVKATNGASQAHVVSLRAYDSSDTPADGAQSMAADPRRLVVG